MNFLDSMMYIRFYKKNLRLRFLKKFFDLDFEGRFKEKNPLFNGYEGCYPVGGILRKLKISKNDSILDIGCGKGLFLYYARKFKFKKVDGVEYSKELFEIATENVKKIGDSRIHLLNCDARDFENYADYNFFFLCNPFSKEVMEVVISKILESYESNNRKITVYYQFPFFKDLFADNGFKPKLCTFLHGVFVLET